MREAHGFGFVGPDIMRANRPCHPVSATRSANARSAIRNRH